MDPRTLAILAVALLAGSIGLREVVKHFGLLPVSEEVVLKKAVSLTVKYYDNGKLKNYSITAPAQVKELLAALRIAQGNDEHYFSFGLSPPYAASGGSVEFHFPNGSRRSHTTYGKGVMGNHVFQDSMFYQKLTEIISQHEGNPVDLSSQPPPTLPKFDFDDGKRDKKW